MTRSYKGVRLKMHRVYTVVDLRDLYGVSANTITNWVKAGLTPSDDQTPYVFRGAEVIAFHEDRRTRNLLDLRPGEFKCMRCKMAVLPKKKTVFQQVTTRSGAPLLMAECPDCGASAMKTASKADLAVLELGPDPNTSGDRTYEEKTLVPGDIGIRREILSS